MTGIGVWSAVAAGGLGVALAALLCVAAAVLAVVWAAPRGWRDIVPLLRHGVIVLLEFRRPACERSTAPLVRIGDGP